MNQALLQQFTLHPDHSLGPLILDAKSGTADNDVRRTWILFGDPSMKFQLGTAATSAYSSSAGSLLLSLGSAPSGTPARHCTAKLPCSQANPQQ